MRALVQRVVEASVAIQGQQIARIGPGLLAFVGVFPDDTLAGAQRLADKLVALRIFADETKPMNRNVVDVAGQILIVSQFTLAADTSKGNRPGFSTAAPPQVAEPLFAAVVERLQQHPVTVQQGVFGADMQVALVNDGPVTLLLDVTD